MAELQGETTHQEGITVIRLSGYLSSESAGPLETAFAQVGAAEKVVVVFQQKDFINSAGLAVLFDWILPAQEQGKQVRLVHPAKHFRKVFDIVGLSKDVEAYAAEEEALVGW